MEILPDTKNEKNVHHEAIESLFEKYAKPLGKTFDKNMIKGESKKKDFSTYDSTWGIINYKGTPKINLIYNHDGVVIEYRRQMRTYLGDTDMFTDYIVKVDGKMLVNENNM